MKIISKPRIFFALSVLCCFFLQNCASTPSGRRQTLPVTSNPPGAKVNVDGVERGLAPLLLHLKRDEGHVLRIEKDGYQPFEIRIMSSASPRQKRGVIGSGILLVSGVVFGGFIGGFVGSAIASDALEGFGAGMLIGIIAGPIGVFAMAGNSGSVYELDPHSINITLTKIGEKPQSSFLLIEAHELANIRWIRIRCSDGGIENLMDLHRTKAMEKLKESEGSTGKGFN